MKITRFTFYFLILLVLMKLLNAQNESKIIEVTSKIIANSFLLQRCLCVISDHSIIAIYVERSLISFGMVVVVLNRDNLLENKLQANCDGYIVVSSNILHLEDVFTKKKGVFQFKAHRRILIFFNGTANFLGKPFSTAVGLQAVDLFVVQKYQSIVTNSFSLNFLGGDELKKHIEIMDVCKRKSVGSWDGNEEFALNIMDFETKTWLPDFSVTSGAKFVASTFNCSPFVFIDANRQVYDGVEHRILREITRTWKFEYKVHDYSFQKDLYNDVIVDVVNGTSDLAMCSHWRIFASLRDMDISYPYTQACVTFLVPKPLLLPNSTFVFQPMANSLWFIILITVITAAVSLWASDNWYQKIVGYRYQSDYLHLAPCVLNVLRILTLNSVTRFPSPHQFGLRFILTSWCLICVILSTGYSAGFSSLLTYPRFYRRINNLQDTIDENIHWGAAESSTKEYLASSGSKRLINIAEQFTIDKTMADKLEKIRQNTYSVMVKVLPRQYITDTDFLDEYAMTHLKVLLECIELQYFVFPLTKNSPYTKIFEDRIKQFYEHGLISYWYSDIREKYNFDYMQNFYTSLAEPIPNRHIPFKIDKIKGALYFLTAGLSMALLAFIVEIYLFRLHLYQF